MLCDLAWFTVLNAEIGAAQYLI